MTYSELELTDDLSGSLPTKINANFRKRSFLNVAAKSADFTVWTDDTAGSPKDVYLVTTAASTITVTLPTVASGDALNGRAVTIMKVDSGAGSVSIDADGSEEINGATTKSLSSQYDFATIVSDGVAWYIVGNN
jgi:hypothetical protein